MTVPMADIETLNGGRRCAEGPVWFADGGFLIWSDIPNNRMLRWTSDQGVGGFRADSNFSNGGYSTLLEGNFSIPRFWPIIKDENYLLEIGKHGRRSFNSKDWTSSAYAPFFLGRDCRWSGGVCSGAANGNADQPCLVIEGPIEGAVKFVEETYNTKLSGICIKVVSNDDVAEAFNASAGMLDQMPEVSGLYVIAEETILIPSAELPSGAADIEIGGGYVWMNTPYTLSLAQIDPKSNSLIRKFSGAQGADAVDFGDDALWISRRSIKKIAVPT